MSRFQNPEYYCAHFARARPLAFVYSKNLFRVPVLAQLAASRPGTGIFTIYFFFIFLCALRVLCG
jgi:hypothetical protein